MTGFLHSQLDSTSPLPLLGYTFQCIRQHNPFNMGIPGEFGFTLTYVYYMHCSEDALIMQSIVAVIWILETLHVSFMCHVLYYYLITNYGNPTSLEYGVWSFPASVLVNSLVIITTQFFFAHKIYHLCRRRQLRWLLISPIVLFILAYFGFATGTAVAMLVNNVLAFAAETKFYTSAPAAFAVVLAEVLITVSLCILLYDGSSRSPFPRTKRLLKALIVYAVNRCLLTLIVTIAQATVVTDANNSIALVIALEFIVGKLYANSLLASLNVREHLQSQDSSRASDLRSNAIYLGNLPRIPDMDTSRDGTKGVRDCEMAVRVNITTEQVFDKAAGSIRVC
ncbi:hypothetical protein EDD15DRAFT_115410 [Pisolithus albus]|nr:hypothetical protein EDD15DRAFT_115410 [Pisolithus albus]